MPDETALAFTEDEVLRLTGLSAWKLHHWIASNVLEPDYAPTFAARGAKLFSFRDLIELRILTQLRKEHSLQALRRIHKYLRGFDRRPWSKLRLFVMEGGGVAFRDPETGRVLAAHGPEGQVIEETLIDMAEVTHRLRDDVKRARQRPKDQLGQIHRKRGLLGNQPVIMGTRIPVALIKRLHDAGYSIAEIQRKYPRLTPADIRAALAFKPPHRASA